MPRFTRELWEEIWPESERVAAREKRAHLVHFRDWERVLRRSRTLGAFRIGKVGVGQGQYREAFNAVVSVDKSSFSRMMDSVEGYKQIPYRMRPALKEVGDYIVENVVPRMFEEEGNRGRGSWQALSELDQDWRERQGFNPGPILEASGDLRRDATSDTMVVDIKTGENARVVIGGDKLGYPNAAKFFAHMSGMVTSPWTGGEIPARPFIPTSDKDFTQYEISEIYDIFREHIERLRYKV